MTACNNSNSIFLEEMEVLQAIYEDELIFKESEDNSSAEVNFTIHPNTADDKDGKYVCLTLHFFFTFSLDAIRSYPHKEPFISIKNPRGLSDSHLASIEENLRSLSVRMTGEQMLFSLIEYAKESLTDNNHPSCDCPICLEKFEEGSAFFRTECYHYFHMRCIKIYIESTSNMTCPVCRLEFQVDESLFESNEVCEDQETAIESFVPDETYLEMRHKLGLLYKKQRVKGGIIDPEFEKNKYLITLADVRSGENELGSSNYDEGNVVNVPNTNSEPSSYQSNYFNRRSCTPPYSPKQKLKYDRSGVDGVSLQLKDIHIHKNKEESNPNKGLLNIEMDKFVDDHNRNPPRDYNMKESHVHEYKTKEGNEYHLKHDKADSASNERKGLGDDCTTRGKGSGNWRRNDKQINDYKQRDNYRRREYNNYKDKPRSDYDNKNNYRSSNNPKQSNIYDNDKHTDRYSPKNSRRRTQQSKGKDELMGCTTNDSVSVATKDIELGKSSNDNAVNVMSDRKFNVVLESEHVRGCETKLNKGNSSSDGTKHSGDERRDNYRQREHNYYKDKPRSYYDNKNNYRSHNNPKQYYNDKHDRYSPKNSRRRTQQSKGKDESMGCTTNDSVSIPTKDIELGKSSNDNDVNVMSDRKLNVVLESEHVRDHETKLDKGYSDSDGAKPLEDKGKPNKSNPKKTYDDTLEYDSKSMKSTSKSRPAKGRGRNDEFKTYDDNTSSGRTHKDHYSDDPNFRNYNKYRVRRPPPGFEKEITKNIASNDNLLMKDSLHSTISSRTRDSQTSRVPPGFEKMNSRVNNNSEINENKSKNSESSSKHSEKEKDTSRHKVLSGFLKNEKNEIS